jgi:hypothetical protein
VQFLGPPAIYTETKRFSSVVRPKCAPERTCHTGLITITDTKASKKEFLRQENSLRREPQGCRQADVSNSASLPCRTFCRLTSCHIKKVLPFLTCKKLYFNFFFCVPLQRVLARYLSGNGMASILSALRRIAGGFQMKISSLPLSLLCLRLLRGSSFFSINQSLQNISAVEYSTVTGNTSE